MKYRKKPVVIEAVKWTGSNLFEVITFTDGEPDLSTDTQKNKWQEYCDLVNEKGFKIKTLESDDQYHLASIGDFIIKGVQGEHYACKPDIFEQTYEPAE